MRYVCFRTILALIALAPIGPLPAFAADLPPSDAEVSPEFISPLPYQISNLETELRGRCRLHQADAYPWAADGLEAIGRVVREYDRLLERRARLGPAARASTSPKFDAPCLDLMNAVRMADTDAGHAAAAAAAPAIPPPLLPLEPPPTPRGPLIVGTPRPGASEPSSDEAPAPALPLSPAARCVIVPTWGYGSSDSLTGDAKPRAFGNCTAEVHTPSVRVEKRRRKRGATHSRESARTVVTARPAPPTYSSSLPVPLSARTLNDHENVIEEFFPWPPRWPTSRWHPVTDLFADRQRYKTLGDVDDYLLGKLHVAGYGQYGHFRIKNTGFAIVTKLERINDKGEPDPQNRFDPSFKPTSSFNLADYTYRLLFGAMGRYRVFVFIFTPEPVNPLRGTRMDYPLAVKWDREGAGHLPLNIRAVPATAEHKLSVLIYEFVYRDGENEVPHVLPDGGIDPAKQLKAANVRLTP